MSLPTLLGYQRASAFVNATKLASQPLFSSDEEYKISNVLSNTFFIDIDHVSIAIHIVIVLSPSPIKIVVALYFTVCVLPWYIHCKYCTYREMSGNKKYLTEVYVNGNKSETRLYITVSHGC